MKVEELRERLEKAEAKVTKIEGTILRHKKQADKKLQVVLDNGWNPEDKYCRFNTEEHYDAYCAVCEYQDKLDDIKSAYNKLEEALKIVNNWKVKLANAEAVQNLINNDIPEALKLAKDELIVDWVEDDIKQRNLMVQRKRSLSHEEFRKQYKYSVEQSLLKSDEEFLKIEEAEATKWMLDLYNRVKDITGEITDCKYLRWAGKALNGDIVGLNGKAEVRTIGAGGYNIQRYHLRVLVQKM